MKKHIAVLITFICVFGGINAQYISSVTTPDKSTPISTDAKDLSVIYASSITPEDLKAHLTILASDEYEGRETGQPGNDKAAKYIADHFQRLGLSKPDGTSSYVQPVNFSFTKWEDTKLLVNDKEYRHLWDYLAFPGRNPNLPMLDTKEVIFLGYGIDDEKYTDYRGKKFKDKTIIINSGEPIMEDGNYRISGTSTKSDWTIDKKLKFAKARGVKMVLIIEEDIKKTLGENRRLLLGPTVELGDKTNAVGPYPNHMYVSTSIAQEIFGDKSKMIIEARDKILKKGKFKNIKLKPHVMIHQVLDRNVIKSQNLLGLVKGKTKPDEVIIVSAHYDHLGKKGDQIFHGADDNGSGTSSILELAQAFAIARDMGQQPDRTVAFMLATGEEKGLLGSEYYVNNPLIPIANTVCDVNVDMVGRQDDKYKDDPNYIYVIGSDRLSTDLHKINEAANQKYTQITLDYTYNSEQDPNRYYYRSDHYNFAEKGIPAIFYFSGVHKDYHQPTDTVDKINFEKMTTIDKLVFHTIWDLASRPERITVDVHPVK
jgi:hypothetical protein